MQPLQRFFRDQEKRSRRSAAAKEAVLMWHQADAIAFDVAGDFCPEAFTLDGFQQDYWRCYDVAYRAATRALKGQTRSRFQDS
jgi:hypothetical protein